MRARLLLALAALLALPACLDPIVETQCAMGYSPCGSKCVPAGSCVIRDAGQAADGEDATLLDTSPGEPESDVDAEAVETGLAADTESATDGNENEVGADQEDGLPPTEAGLDDDAGGEMPAIDAESDDAGLDGPEGAPSDAPTANSGHDGGTPAVEIDGASVADDTGVALLGADAAETGDGASDGTGVPIADDGGTDDANGEGAANSDASITEADGALQEAGPLQCQTDLTSDLDNCGECGNRCPTGYYCADSTCQPCAQTICGWQCVNTGSNRDNCGYCGVACKSGLCSNSQCDDSGTGRVIVIGHDYLANKTTMSQVLPNAVFLWSIKQVRLLAYKVWANSTAVGNANDAIAYGAGRREFEITFLADEDDIAAQLAAADVFLIYGQEYATDPILTELRQKWANAITTFVNRGGTVSGGTVSGGTVIVLDGVYANQGTVQVISQAGLFDVQQNASVTDAVCTVVAPGDALASGLLRNYLCEQNSVGFTTSEGSPSTTFVVSSGGDPVVLDKVFP
jgi:hypothetical protein